MKKRLRISLILMVVSISSVTLLHSDPWGIWGHKRINRVAVFTLPTEMMGFFKENIYYIATNSIDSDIDLTDIFCVNSFTCYVTGEDGLIIQVEYDEFLRMSEYCIYNFIIL